MNKQVKPRVKNDSLKDIPKDVRHSLQFLDNLLDEFDDEKRQSPVPTLRSVKNVPTYARKSLEILDSILSEYDVREEETRRCESVDNLRVPCDAVSVEVSKSLEVLDQVLDEFQNEGGQQAFRIKQSLDGKESLRKPKHEDIRRSLEVLDSVLAEFDDCLESWDSITQDVRDEDSNRILKEKDLFFSNGNLSTTSFTYGSKTIDGDTSHDSGLSLQEQSKVTSPPPIPKRSATTKLSDRNSGLFTFPLVTSHSFDSLQSESSVLDNDASLSPSDAISIVSAKEDDEVFKRKDNNAQFHCCTKCGCEIEAPMKGHMMENKQEKDMSSSPFSERRKMFEDRIGESRINVSPLLERSFNGSSFKVKTDRTKECESEPTSLTFYKSGENDRSDSSHSSFASKYSPKATKVAPPRVGLLSLPNNLHHAPNCNCKERIRELQMKFAETRRLLKSNKIKGLDKRPPSFVPPPPLEVVSKNIRNEIQDSNKQRTNGLENSLISEFKDYYTSNGNANLDSLTSEENSGSFHSNPSVESEENSIHNSLQEKLCNRCSKSVHLPLSETIEDIPKLLPTDALKRPHLGLSYSMEDDLCPGVKEILQTSTPRSGLLSRTHKAASLSTFSLSDSSLGYVSSQSDLELNNSPIKPEKVPVSTLKCSTLPEAGMDLHSLPSYYGHDADPQNERKSNQPVYKDRNFNNTSDPQLRSSSAPPLPETEKPKKKHFRVFSRKEKKDKKTNEDNVSVTSYLSLDDSITLKSLDGDTIKLDAVDSRETGTEKKRWSGLRSILRKR